MAGRNPSGGCVLLEMLNAEARALLLGALAALASCAPRSGGDDDPGPARVDPEIVRSFSKRLQQYINALLLCGSTLPLDWDKARRELELIQPFSVFDEDRELIRQFRGGSDAARLELARRGRVLNAITAFWEPYDKYRWESAQKALLAEGDVGRHLLVKSLFNLLLNGQYRHIWVNVRYGLVEAGPMALETARELGRALAAETPAEAPVFRIEDLTQVLLVVMGFGDAGRGPFMEMAGHAKPNVRRAAARAIGEGMDASYAETLARLMAADPAWQVRATAAEACGRLAPARRTMGPALVDRIGKERERLVQVRVVRAIADLLYVDGIPDLVRVLDVPSLELQEAAMQALYILTGERHVRPDRWKEWFATKYPEWRKRREGQPPR